MTPILCVPVNGVLAKKTVLFCMSLSPIPFYFGGSRISFSPDHAGPHLLTSCLWCTSVMHLLSYLICFSDALINLDKNAAEG